VIVDAGADLAGVAKLRRAIAKLGAEVLVIAPVGGVLSDGADTEVVQRSLLTARSVEFDAVVDRITPTGDIKLVLPLQEAFRHCKTIASWGSGTDTLVGAGSTSKAPVSSSVRPSPRRSSTTSSPRSATGQPVWDVVEATGIEAGVLRAQVAHHALRCTSWQIRHTDDVPRRLDRAERVLDRYDA
jgi:hypothetical protein